MAVEFHLYHFVAPAPEPGPIALATMLGVRRSVIGSRLGLTTVRDDVAGICHG
jgi:hypothetical protein